MPVSASGGGRLHHRRRVAALLSSIHLLVLPRANIAVTYLLKDDSAGKMTIPCSDGGSNNFFFEFGHTSSSVTVDTADHGNAKVYFNDNSNNYVSGCETGTR